MPILKGVGFLFDIVLTWTVRKLSKELGQLKCAKVIKIRTNQNLPKESGQKIAEFGQITAHSDQETG